MRAFYRISSRQPLRLARPGFQQPTIRPFSFAQQLRLKEDKHQDPEELDRIKHEQIEKQKKGEGHWHEELASGSESHLKADKEEPEDHSEHMEDLQKETADKHEKDHEHGKAEH